MNFYTPRYEIAIRQVRNCPIAIFLLTVLLILATSKPRTVTGHPNAGLTSLMAFEHRFSTKNKVVVVPISHFKRGQTSEFKQLWVYEDKQKKSTLGVVEYFHAESDNGNNSNGFVVPQDGGGGSNNDCDFQGPLELNRLVNSLSVSNQTKSITREKKYEWIILKGFGWYLFSMEVGTHVKTSNANPNLQWEWKSLEHKDISKVGIVIGGSVDYSLRNASATLGRYNAIMDVDFKVKSSVACAGSPFEIELVYNSNKVFNVND